MKAPQARVFLEGVVLDAVRENINDPSSKKDHRKLNVHYYDSLIRALYKPMAFFKGILFPMLDVSGANSNLILRSHMLCFRTDAR